MKTHAGFCKQLLFIKTIIMPTNIRIYGKKQAKAAVEKDSTKDYFELEEAYEISQSRSDSGIEKVSIEDDRFVEIVFTDNSTWFGDSNTLKEIFPELKAQTRSANDAPLLPISLNSDDASRSLIGDIALKFLRKFAKKEVQKGIRKVAEEIEEKALGNRRGLFSITEDFDLAPFKDTAAKVPKTQPTLLFIHGTSSSTKGAFGELVASEVWNETVKKYGTAILGFEHRTLTISPVQNVFELINDLPANTTYDVITHSRGGIVGELLVRFCESEDGFLKQSLELFKEEGRLPELKYIEDACTLAAKKQIKIRRFIRVACTARGTSLLSDRTDIFLNTIINLINISSNILVPVIGGIKMLISETINSKNSFTELPGLEAQRPGSSIIKALNTYKAYDEKNNPVGFDNRLIVISGNGKFSLSLNGLKIVLTKFFFKWEQNDLVVDTVSMYQGAKRKSPVQYFLDNGTDTNHFNYFLNQTTRDALRQALFSNTDLVPTFKEIQGESFDAAAGRGIFGLENGKLAPVKPKGKKPIVILLPGIMGSFLEQNDRPVWINYLRFATGGLTRLSLGDDDNIKATGVIKTAYSDLADYLSEKYDVLVFPFDWRRPLEKAGENLAADIEDLKKLKVPILLAGHSMGGLVIRDMIINHGNTWKWLNEQPGFRVLLLGTPWLGSYRIPHVLSGKDSIIKQLDLIDFAHSKTTLINMFSKFSGLLDLLPVHGNTDFGSKKVWQDFMEASGMSIEEIPKQLLDNFTAYTKKIKAGIDSIDYSNIVYVAGKYKETVKDYKIENGSLKFYATAEGDQSVTWESGIPAKIDRTTSLYYTNASHGSLSKKAVLFPGILDILQNGSTASHEFSRLPMPVSEGDRSFESKEEFEFETSEANIESGILGLGEFISTEESNTPILNISVSNGDLMFAKYPVMIGHFVYDDIYNAENVVDTYLQKALRMKHKLGLYPGPIGSSEFFPNHDENNDFPGSIIVGLGLSESLNPYQLTLTIEKAVSHYLLTCCKNEVEKQSNNKKKKIGLSTLLIGADYTGMAIESVCRAIMQGVINANEKVITLTSLPDLYISELEFIELMEDKSIMCFTSINTLIQGNNDGMNVGWSEKAIGKYPGARKRLFTDVTNTWWQRLCVLAESDLSLPVASTKLSFYSSTNNAREEKKEMTDNLKPLESMFEDISTGKQWSYDKAKALFELLIPSDFKENIKRNAPIMWVLDKYTASFPWELLQTGAKTEKPLCVSAGMIRQLAISDFEPAKAVKSNNVIIIGDPNLNGFTRARQLPGAAREAREVYDLLNKPEYKDQVNLAPPLINANSGQIFIDLFKQDYKIIHIAAHGFFDKKNPLNTGILIGKDEDTDEPIFLTPQRIQQLPGTPELVFINSCFLGKVNPYAEELSASRYKLAANIGTELIKIGVKAVVVAGWEVDDSAALAFAKEFYKEMLQGKNFGEATLQARKYVYKNFNSTNTWGAFQCYGQPQFTLNINSHAAAKTVFDIPQQAENKLDTLISKSEVAFYDGDWLIAQLKDISEAIAAAKFTGNNLKQLEAKAYHELNDYETAITILNELFKSEAADFSVSSLETFQDIMVKKAMIDFFAAEEARKVNASLIKNTVEIIDRSIGNIDRLLDIWETSERYSLIASASKRKARVFSAKKDKEKALTQAAQYYYSAFKILKDSYNFSNWLSIKIFLGIPKTKWAETYIKDRKPVKEMLTPASILQMVKDIHSKKAKGTNVFWNLSQPADLALCRFLLEPGVKNNLRNLKDEYENIWKKTGSKNKKKRQRDNIDLLIHFAEFTGKKEIASGLLSLKKQLAEIK